MDGSQIWISQVNDGNHDCSDGDDEMLDHDDEHMGPYNYDNCADSDHGLSSLDCWDNDDGTTVMETVMTQKILTVIGIMNVNS